MPSTGEPGLVLLADARSGTCCTGTPSGPLWAPDEDPVRVKPVTGPSLKVKSVGLVATGRPTASIGSVNAPLSAKVVQRLLDDLCTCLGFCVPPEDQARLRASPPTTPDAFTDAVFVAVGLDPETSDSRLRQGVYDQVAVVFDRST
jgi:hypothetical protein